MNDGHAEGPYEPGGRSPSGPGIEAGPAHASVPRTTGTVMLAAGGVPRTTPAPRASSPGLGPAGPTPLGQAAPARTPAPSLGARGSLPSLDPALRAQLAGYEGTDLEQSVDIPPPPRVDLESERPPGAKDPYVGTTFDGRYKIERPLGEGGMGIVYQARHKVIDKRVAVKVLRADLAKDREIVDRFVQEAKSASSIGNPHIVDISDFGDLPDGSTYFVMEYLEGEPLTKHIEKRLDVPRLCQVALQIADGLAAAHAVGIVHRDLKPDNVYLIARGAQRDFVKILDFGIAKVSNNATTKLTRAGAVFGTPHYMSPEQAAGHPVDHRADIYSLGVIMYEMASGQLPFNADNFMGILTQHMYKAPVPIRALVNNSECPPGLEAIVQKCLSKKPDQRYGGMEELAEDIRRLLRGESPLAVAELMSRSSGISVPLDYFKSAGPGGPALGPPERSRLPVVAWVAGGLVLSAAVVGTWLFVADDAPPPAATAAETTATSAAEPAAPAPTRPAEKVVALAASPDTAHAVRGGEKLSLPATIRIPDGEKVTLEIVAEGHVSQTVELDGSSESKMVRLEKVPAEPSARPTAAPARPPAGAKPPGPKPGPQGPKKPPPGGGEIRDPWR